MDEMKQVISQSLRDDFQEELRKERRTTLYGGFDVSDAMAAFDRIFEVALPLKQEAYVPLPKNPDAAREMARRCYVDQYVAAEKAIFEAMKEVEKMPADIRLTKAVMLLGDAKDWVSDFVDGVQREVK